MEVYDLISGHHTSFLDLDHAWEEVAGHNPLGRRKGVWSTCRLQLLSAPDLVPAQHDPVLAPVPVPASKSLVPAVSILPAVSSKAHPDVSNYLDVVVSVPLARVVSLRLILVALASLAVSICQDGVVPDAALSPHCGGDMLVGGKCHFQVQ